MRPEPEKATPNSSKTILMVDDDRQLATTLQWILADKNLLVDAVFNGTDALAKVKEKQYDIVVCDVMMPHLRGDQFYQEAVAIRPTLANRFIFMTGYAADHQINIFLYKTGSKYLMKPFPVQKLIDCVQQVLAAKPPRPATDP